MSCSRKASPTDRIRIERKLAIKYAGTDSTLQLSPGVTADSIGEAEATQTRHAADIATRFYDEYRQRYGFLMSGRALIVESISVEAIGASHELPSQARGDTTLVAAVPSPIDTRDVYFPSAWQQTPFFERDVVTPGREGARTRDHSRTQHDHRDRAGLASRSHAAQSSGPATGAAAAA